MDGQAFDRLSVVVHQLREQTTRRGALGVLLGGAAAAIGGLVTEDASARRRKKNRRRKRCRNFGGSCFSHRDCCGGNCRNGFCWQGGGRHGNNRCGGQNCPSGWSCRQQGGVSVCVPNDFQNCCGNFCYGDGFNCCGSFSGSGCPIGWDCCGGFQQCCGPDQHCCGNGRCCPDGWQCNGSVCDPFWDDSASAESSQQSVPTSDPVKVDGKDFIEITPS